MSERAVWPLRRWFGKRLRALRNGLGVSQQLLGKMAKCSGRFIGELERGEKSVSIDTLSRIADALDVPLRELTDYRKHPKDEPSRASEELSAFAVRLKEPEREKALGILRAAFPAKKK
jgi:transcriptional regulator with XRE-family HTH domain